MNELNQIKSALQSENNFSDKNEFISLNDLDDLPVSLDDFDISFDYNKIDELEEKVGFASFENTNNKVVETNIEFNVEP